MSSDRPPAVLGVIVAPGLAHELTARIAEDLLEDLRERYGTVDWKTELEVDRLVEPPAPVTQIFSTARERLLDKDWDLGVVVTDLPLNVGRRTVSTRVNPTHGIAVISLPALGAINLRPRLRRALLELVGELIGERDEEGVLRELVSETTDRPGLLRVGFVPRVLFSHLRLLLGMVRANRPWRFTVRLNRALVAALAASAYGLVTADVWRLGASMGWSRLAALSVASIVTTIIAIIGTHGLWERRPDPRVRRQVALFNIATAATVAVGIVSLYLELFALILVGLALVVSPDALTDGLGRDVGVREYLGIAWFVASIATVGGGLGAALESDEAIREAAYASSQAVEPEEP